jgi:hypothetical protein
VFSRLSRYLIRICLAIPDLAHAPARKIRRRKIEQARYERKMLVSFMPALGAKMIIDPTTYFSDVFVKGFYEIDLVNYFKKSLRPGMTSFDIGENICYF